MRYALFFRGINVGGKVLIKMSDLKNDLEKAGFKNVKTILASGNALVEAPSAPLTAIEKKAEDILRKKWKRDIFVIARTIDDIKKLHSLNPFKKIIVTEDTRRYVTFLKGEPKGRLKLPFHAPEHDYSVLAEKDLALFSVLQINPETTTPDVMKIIDSTYGKMMTTRNWNTIEKIIKAA